MLVDTLIFIHQGSITVSVTRMVGDDDDCDADVLIMPACVKTIAELVIVSTAP